jgi:choline dehydrogenase-like flavoprotein
MLGCRCGAKWNAAEWVDEAVAAGCSFVTEARVHEVIVEEWHAVGVRGRLKRRPFEIRARTVVLAAGGIGTPPILRRSGLAGAGRGVAMDTTVIAYGTARERGNATEPPMTYAWADDENGYLLSTLVEPWLMYPVSAVRAGAHKLLTWPRWQNTLGVMIKLKDDVSGALPSEREIDKPLTPGDRARLRHATAVSRRILIEAGAGRDSIFLSPPRGTHPCATVRVGDLLDSDLQTEIPGLYVCDASAFPEALARPTVLTIIGLGKRLSEHLVTQCSRIDASQS